MREIFKIVKDKLASKYLKESNVKSFSNSAKKFKPRIKARIRKNKQFITKNIEDLFGWIKGAELVELKECNTNQPGQEYLLKENGNIQCFNGVEKNACLFAKIGVETAENEPWKE